MRAECQFGGQLRWAGTARISVFEAATPTSILGQLPKDKPEDLLASRGGNRSAPAHCRLEQLRCKRQPTFRDTLHQWSCQCLEPLELAQALASLAVGAPMVSCSRNFSASSCFIRSPAWLSTSGPSAPRLRACLSSSSGRGCIPTSTRQQASRPPDHCSTRSSMERQPRRLK